MELTGTIISHYRVLREIGRGGMGVVFEAEDLNLGRKVALKFLPGDIGGDAVSLERFRREARTLSSLNHPNICTVYEIGEFEQRHFIAMELLEGDVLKQRLTIAVESMDTQVASAPLAAGGPLKPDRIIEWAIQLADALDAAHTEGVIHRDIKPQNIFITKRGYAKILDFGLAKQVHDSLSHDSGQLTKIGARVGTLSYMSPEQALGRELDGRTDLFSIGVVLYEMATGRLPFVGSNTGVVFDAILHQSPPPPSSINAAIPADLDAVIFKCLEKDPQQRYQSASQLGSDLKLISRESSHSGSQALSAGLSAASSGHPHPLQFWMRVGWAGFAGLALVCGILLWKVLQKPAAPQLLEPVLQRLTTDSGLSLQPAISRDAKMLAYASDRSGEGNLDIWVRQVGGGDPIRITHDSADDDEPDFSPDGTRLAFHSARRGGGVYVVPVLGGQERRIADGGRQPRFSPSGQQIAYWTGEPFREVPLTPRSAAIYIVDVEGGAARRLQLDLNVATRPLWTPDGAHLLFWGSEKQGGATPKGWWVVPAAGGPAAPVSFASPAFTPDMIAGSTACGWRDDKVVFSMRHEDNLAHIYEAPFSFAKWQVTGPPHRLTFGTAQEESPSVASDGRLAFASLTTNLDVYSLPLDANRGIPNGPPEKLTHDIADDAYASLSSDGRTLAFQSYRSGRPEIWLKHLADGKEERLASGESPVVSPDGTSVAFIQDLKRLMIIPTEGGVMREISSRPLTAAAWSPDQRFLLAAEYGKPRVSIEVLDIGSGKTIGSLAHPREHLFPRGFSPDGGWISFSKASPEGQILMIAPFRLSSPPGEEEWFAVTDSFTNDFQPRWSVDGRILYFISERDGFACIWARRMDVATQRPTGDPFAVLHLHGASRRMRTGVRPLSVARDKLAFSMEERAGSIWTLQFR